MSSPSSPPSSQPFSLAHSASLDDPISLSPPMSSFDDEMDKDILYRSSPQVGGVRHLAKVDNLIVSVANENIVKVWNPCTDSGLTTPVYHYRFEGHTTCLSSYLSSLVRISSESGVVISNPLDETPLCTFHLGERVDCVTVVEEDSLALGGSAIGLLSLEDKVIRGPLVGFTGTATVIKAYENGSLIAGTSTHQIAHWHGLKSSNVQLLAGHLGAITGLTLLQKTFVSSDETGKVIQWDKETLRPINTFVETSRVNVIDAAIHFGSPTIIAFGLERGEIKLCDSRVSYPISILNPEAGPISSLSFLESRKLAAGCDSVILYDLLSL